MTIKDFDAVATTNNVSPKAIRNPIIFPEVSGCKNEYVEVLGTMLNEQSEHLYGKFTESYLKYRGVVMVWMIDVCEYFRLHITTSHMALAYLDRIQPNERFSRFEWQILAIACIIIAAKYNEMEENVPPLKRIQDITQQEIPNDTFLYYELWALKKMGWKLNARVPSCFITAQIELGLFSEQETLPVKRFSPMPNNYHSNRKVKMTPSIMEKMQAKMFELCNKCMLEVKCKPIQASAMATAIIYYVRRHYQVLPLWSDRLTDLCFHDPRSSQSVMKALTLLMEMDQPVDTNLDNSGTLNSSNLLAPSDFDENDLVSLSDEEMENGSSDGLDGTDDLEMDDCEEDDEEEADLVKAIHKALFIDQTTPSKVTLSQGSSMITPNMTIKNGNKGSFEADLSPVAIAEMVSP